MYRGIKRQGFTLMELLVVMAVIMLLAAIGYPVYSTAKDYTYTTKCKVQLGGIGRAFAMYQSEHHGWLPRCDQGSGKQDPEETGYNRGNPIRWKMILSMYMADRKWDDYKQWEKGKRGVLPLHKAWVDPTRGVGDGVYMASKGQFEPIPVKGSSRAGLYDATVFIMASKLFVEQFRRQPTDSDNAWIHGKAVELANNPSSDALKRPMNMQEFKHISHAAIVGPTKKSTVHYAYTAGVNSKPTKVTSTALNQIDFRHRGGIANVLFLDGHVMEFTKGDKESERDLIDRWNNRYLLELGID